MPENLLEAVQISPILQIPRGERMPEQMGAFLPVAFLKIAAA